MAIPVQAGTRIVFPGDSTAANAWYDETQSSVGGTNLLVQQLSSVADVARVGSVSGTVGAATGHVGSVAPVVGGGQVYAIDTGVGGWQTADLLANLNARVMAHNPDVVVITIGINDVRQVPGPVTLAQFRANCDAINSQIQAALPGVPVVWMAVFCFREQWSSTPPPAHFAGNPVDADIALFNAQMQASALSFGYVYCDDRSPAALLESTLNTPAPGAIDGILTLDGIHQNAAGQRSMSDTAYPLFVFSE